MNMCIKCFGVSDASTCASCHIQTYSLLHPVLIKCVVGQCCSKCGSVKMLTLCQKHHFTCNQCTVKVTKQLAFCSVHNNAPLYTHVEKSNYKCSLCGHTSLYSCSDNIDSHHLCDICATTQSISYKACPVASCRKLIDSPHLDQICGSVVGRPVTRFMSAKTYLFGTNHKSICLIVVTVSTIRVITGGGAYHIVLSVLNKLVARTIRVVGPFDRTFPVCHFFNSSFNLHPHQIPTVTLELLEPVDC